MNWKQITNGLRIQPDEGEYPDWKEQIAKDCFYQCVYCSINEANWGGIDHYHIDHFRPKSNPEFEHLRNDITNLFYACPVCNRFKSDDWPGEPDLNTATYPDPSAVDIGTLVDFDEFSFKISGKYVSARYLIWRLYLNRPQLIYERRESTLRQKELDLFNEVKELLFDMSDPV